jgi:tetratricopeptide (TPR) repeat protein
LEALAARHPTRERLRYLQMLALYRAGRQRDALAAYQETRAELVERYGLEPGEDLRALERMILVQDESLRAPATRPAPPADRERKAVVLAIEPPHQVAHEAAEQAGADVRLLPRRSLAVWGAHRARDDDAIRALGTAALVRSALGAAAPRLALDRVTLSPDREIEFDGLLDIARGDFVVGRDLLPLIAHAVDVVPHSRRGYRVLRVDTGADAFPRRLDAPLVGRASELEQIAATIDGVRAGGSPRRVVLVGDAGIGKTRLAREVAARATGGARVLEARCRPSGAGAIAQLLAQIGPVGAVVAGQPDADEIVRTLEAAARTPSEEQWALRRALETLAADAPVVVVLDDLQWAEPPLLDLVEYLLGWSHAPIVLLCLGRSELLENRPAWRSDAIVLDRLSDAEAAELAAHLAPDAPEDAARAAEGNPLYLEQLVAWSAEAGAAGVPPTLEVLLLSRVDALPADERRALEAAAVVGLEFWRGAVEAAFGDDDAATIGPTLLSLVRRRLLTPDHAPIVGEDGFRFRHALIRDVVYENLPGEARADLHQRVARALPEGPDHEATVGDHLAAAAELGAPVADEAAAALGGAGLRALRLFESVRAAELLGRAAALLPSSSRRRELEVARAAALKWSGHAAQADELLTRVAVDAERAGDELNELRACVEQVLLRLARSELSVAEARALLDRGTEAFDAAGDEFATARACDLAAAVEGIYSLRFVALEDVARRAIELYARVGSPTGPAWVRVAIAACIGATPVPAAVRKCEASLAAVTAPVWASFIFPGLAMLEAMRDDVGEARRLLERARVERAEFADPRTLSTSWASFAARVEVLAGDVDRAVQILTDALGDVRAIGDVEWTATNGAHLADALCHTGAYADALEHADEALRIGPAEHLTSRSPALRARAKALAALGRADEARALAEGLVALLAGTDALTEQAEAQLALAASLRAGGRDDERARAEAVCLFEQKGDVVSAARAMSAL